jgi:hypothetical protein
MGSACITPKQKDVGDVQASALLTQTQTCVDVSELLAEEHPEVAQASTEDSLKYTTESARQPVYVGTVTDVGYQGLLYFDSGSTGTRLYVFIRRSDEASPSEFWALTRAKEIETVKIHTCIRSEEHSNEDLLKRLKAASSEEAKLALLEGLQLSEEFIDTIKDAVTQAAKIVNKWMEREEAGGVKFWENGSALLISDIVIAITGGLRAVVGESLAVVREVNARLTGHLVSRLRQAYVLNGVRLVARLLPGSEEARCEAAAVRVLSGMQGPTALGGAAAGVISMGGASVQISIDGTSLSIPMGRNLAIEAVKREAAGEGGQLDAFATAFAAAREAALAEHPDLTQAPRTWIAVSGLYYTARDLNSGSRQLSKFRRPWKRSGRGASSSSSSGSG